MIASAATCQVSETYTNPGFIVAAVFSPRGDAKIVTLDEKTPRAQAIAIAGDKVIGVGARRDLERLKSPSTNARRLCVPKTSSVLIARRRILSKYASYYNEVRMHLSLGKDAPCTRPIEDVAYAIRKLISVGRARHAMPLAGRGNKVRLPTNLLVEVLQEAARQPFESDGDGNEATMFQHYVAEILQLLDERNDVDRNALVALEWNYLRVLEHSRRPAKVLLKALSEQPSLFIEMLSAVFKASEESGVVDPEPQDPEHARAVATQAYRLLELWNQIPGTRDDGMIDGEALEAWIKEARALAKAAGREDIADSRIGNMLSASPMGSDGNWPAEAVREVIDLFRSKAMIEGFQIGTSNRRGVTTRMPGSGGELERQEAAKYRTWAKAIAYDHPHTAKALDTLAESYDWEARRHDEDAERLDWES